ncbi:MAG: gliding motility-associated C-terminal domain-containing protein [Bacteroidales bacterium]
MLAEITAHNAMLASSEPTLSLSLSPTGTLYLTANTLSADSTLFKTATSTSYQQSAPLLPTESLSGLILSFSLCDTNFYPPIPLNLRDTLICKDDPFSLEVTLEPPNANFRQRIWNKGMPNEYIGDRCPVNTFGSYYAEIQSIYTQCSSIYSDTLHVDTLPAPHIDLSLSSDTLSFCVGASTHILHATNLGASYLWQDGSTDSTYAIRYQGDSLRMLWCHVRTPCGQFAADTLWARFYPPYAYLGEDTLLCHQDSLPLDASLLNANLPADLSYLWIFNGDTLPGAGLNGALYTLHYPDSGTLILQVQWVDSLSQCNIALDTLSFFYYRGADIHFSIQDTTICAGSIAHLQIQTHSESPEAHYTWYNAEGTPLQEGKYFSTQDSGTYTIVGRNPCSRQESEFKLRLSSPAWIALNIPTDTLLCPQEELCLDVRIPHHPTIYQWADHPDYTLGYRCFTQSGDYELSLLDTVGCSATYTLHIQSSECTPILEMPNVFTPNGDGINDLFGLKTSEKVYNFEILIYNAWGLKVYDYKGFPENFQWNGTHKSSSRPVPDGSYFYIAVFKDYQGKSKKQSGSITILR